MEIKLMDEVKLDDPAVERLALVIADARREHVTGGVNTALWKRHAARQVLRHLDRAHRLLPPDGKPETRWATKVTDLTGAVSYVVADDREQAEQAVATIRGLLDEYYPISMDALAASFDFVEWTEAAT